MGEQVKFSKREREIMDIVYDGDRPPPTSWSRRFPTTRRGTASARCCGSSKTAAMSSTPNAAGSSCTSPPSRSRRSRGPSLQRLLGTFFEGSIQKAVAAHLADPDAEISDDELKRLEKMIREARRGK